MIIIRSRKNVHRSSSHRICNLNAVSGFGVQEFDWS